MTGPRGKRLAIPLALVTISCALLVGCSPAPSSAVRLNEDGSIDFVSCDAVSDVAGAVAATTLRTGPNGSIDDSTEVRTELDPPISTLVWGRFIHFDGVPDGWDRVDVYIDTPDDGPGAYAYAERENLKVGEWRWMDAGGIGLSNSHCSIGDAQHG